MPTAHLKMLIATEVSSICLKTSNPIVAIITAATLSPFPTTWTIWNRRRPRQATSEACHGTRKSMNRPTRGARATPTMPINPKRPMINLGSG